MSLLGGMHSRDPEVFNESVGKPFVMKRSANAKSQVEEQSYHGGERRR
jgi:hypothetical protein